MAGRWYYICEAAELEAVRRVLPVAPGEPRCSRAGDLVILRLTAYVDGAISHAQAAAKMQTDAWRRDDEQ